ncbi:MAG: RNA-binding protein [archaeon]
MEEANIPNITRKKIQELLKENRRLDGRTPFEFREITVEKGISKNAEGSARVKIGDTEVIAGVKMEIMEPFPDSEDKGILMVGAELRPIASELFEMGPPRMDSIGLARTVDRCVRESDFINFEKLCIKKGEKVWAILLDIYAINDAGNLTDASAIAAVAALLDSVFPEVEGEKVKYGTRTKNKLPLTGIPFNITGYQIGDHFLFDPDDLEENVATGKMSFAVSFDKELTIHGALKSNEATTSIESIDNLLTNIKKEAEKVYKNLVTAYKK